jgi:hypothetical protein
LEYSGAAVVSTEVKGDRGLERQIQEHIRARVEATYPDAEFGSAEGAVPQNLLAMLRAQDEEESKDISAFDMKQATMPDMSPEGSNMFEGVRPTIVVDEGETRDTFSKEIVMESVLPDKVSGIDVSMSNTFENQFVSHYNSRVFPWALNYDCGVPTTQTFWRTGSLWRVPWCSVQVLVP